MFLNCIFFTVEELWDHLRKASKDYYPIYTFWCGPVAFIYVLHPDDIEVKKNI